MAKNRPYGDNARKGAVRSRSQTYNPVKLVAIRWQAPEVLLGIYV